MKKTIVYILILAAFNSCNAQTKPLHMDNKTGAAINCDTITGICENPSNSNTGETGKVVVKNKPVKILYFTDPICSFCWGIEPQLRKLKLEYGNSVDIEYIMGGLLPDWSYNAGGISKPSDVAHHWDEVSKYFNMPIDGNVWLEDPLPSSYPPSIAFKAAQMQDEEKALKFLRVLREMVFVEKKNITRWEHLSAAATNAGLDTIKFKTDYEGKAVELFKADLDMARRMRISGFPTLIFTGTTGRTEMINGFKPYTVFENNIKTLYPKAEKTNYSKSWEAIFAIYPTLTTREFAELTEQTIQKSEAILQELVNKSQLSKIVIKNGVLWKKK